MRTIRKSFNFNMAHIVRKAYSTRCRTAIHSHTYQVELFFESNDLNEAEMLVDFGEIKSTVISPIKDFFNEAYCLMESEPEDFKKAIKQVYPQVVETNFNPTAERLSEYIYHRVSAALKKFGYPFTLKKARVHETVTGWAEYTE